MQSEYIAHRKEDTGEIQTVKAHSEETAELCREYAVDEMKQAAYVAGLYHDLGWSATRRWENAGKFPKKNHELQYSGGTLHLRGTCCKGTVSVCCWTFAGLLYCGTPHRAPGRRK